MKIMNFYGKLKNRGKGAKDWINSFTEVEYLGENKFAASITPMEDGHLRRTATTQDGCPTGTLSRTLTGNYIIFGGRGTPISSEAYRGYVEWDITGIPGGVRITDTVFKYHGEFNAASDEEINPITEEAPSGATDANLWGYIVSGISYVDIWDCIRGVNKSQDLGAGADADLQTAIDTLQSWFALGFASPDNECRPLSGPPPAEAYSSFYSDEKIDATPKPTLYVEYMVPTDDLCTWIRDKGGPDVLSVGDVSVIIDSYLYNTPPDGYNFIPTIQNVFGVINYYLGFDGDLLTGCNFYG